MQRPIKIDQVTAALRDRLKERLSANPTLRSQHANTASWVPPEPPDLVIFPETAEEVAFVVSVCGELGVPIIPFGAGTSVEGQVNAPFGGVCLDMTRMNRVLRIGARDLDCTVEPGITRKALNLALRDQGLFFPIDPGADATLGGMASTRASGTNAVRYGTMKDNVLALEAVMPDGRIIRTANRARKTATGYDLTRLLVGAEGTLGIITKLTLRLHGIPEAIAVARCHFPSIEAACDAAIASIQFGLPLARMELMDALTVGAINAYSDTGLPEQPILLVEFHGSPASVAEQLKNFEEIVSDYGATDLVSVDAPEECNKLWQARHDAWWAALRMRPGCLAYTTDVCVPLSRLSECVSLAGAEAQRLGLLAPTVGHVGDGNFHMLVLLDPDSTSEKKLGLDFASWLANLAMSMDGTCTGEHGIGQGKQDALRRELGDSTEYMSAIKVALDPLGIMNPGKIF